MNQELLARLRRLGVARGAHHINTDRPRQSPQERTPSSSFSDAAGDDPRPIEQLLPGLRLEETAEGACYVLDKVYPLDYRHGAGRLANLLQLSPEPAATFCEDDRLANLDFSDFLFLDTETTGLSGAGALAFMVGVAFFEEDAFVARQFFLRDHADEPAMLLLLDALLAERAALTTFNGRAFDLRLLDNRYLLNRMPGDLLDRPHVDLLPPARRLWRRRLPSCALSSLEQSVLGLQRTEEDVPGWLIPGIYNHYLRSGDGRDLTRVFYHNRMDLLSMVTLAARIVRQFARPQPGDHPLDLLGVGQWQVALGLETEAERVLRMAAVPELETPHYQDALTHLAYLLKRSERREEAVVVWQQIAATTFDDVTAHVELAKHFEWHDGDLEQALLWTERALSLVDADDETRAELQHRRARLMRKLDRQDDADQHDRDHHDRREP